MGLESIAKKAGSFYTLGAFDGKDMGSTAYDPAREAAIKARYAKMQGDVANGAGPKVLAAETNGYKAQESSAGLEKHNTALTAQANAEKLRATQAINAQAQGANDAISRRFAAMGASGSGAAVKQTSQVFSDASDKSTDVGNQIQESLSVQIGDAQRAHMENEANREFQSGEALKGRNAGREQYNAESEFKDKVFRFDASSKLSALEMQETQMDRDAQDQAFNKEMANYQKQHSGGLLGGGGILGTGMGA